MKQLIHSFSGSMAPPEVIAAVREGDIAAICLFAYSNVRSPGQLQQLTMSLHRAALDAGQPPLLIGIDQEGGQLTAIANGATELPGNMALGATRSPELAEQAGRILGRELLAMGININFAPSVDVNINPYNPVIGVRSFGDDPQLVSELGAALIRGIQKEGVLATAKHFPGHGDTVMDSHHGTPVVNHSLERMHAVELAPFRAAIDAGVAAIMTAHIRFMALDAQNPATFSKAILTDLLRDKMNFKGLIITDAMDMAAVSRVGEQENIEAALEAGTDLVLLGHLEKQLALTRKTRDLARADSLVRIQNAQQNAPRKFPSLDIVGCQEHQQMAQNIADRSITVVRDGGILPLELLEHQPVAVITVTPMDLTPADTSSGVTISLADAVQRRHNNILAMELPYRAADAKVREIINAVGLSRVVIVGTINADQDPAQAELVATLCNRGKRVIVVSMRTPYDITAFPMVETYLCAYGIRSVSTEAVARVLFGEIEATGVLPCAIPGLD